MSDLIDRQAAIDAYGDWYVEEGTEDGFIGTVKQLLEGFPSAQLGTNLAEVGTDCISRQAAIGALRNYLVGKNVPCDGTLTCRLIENEVINKLPPAQPERIKGHWICDRSWSEGAGMGESYGHYWKCDKCGHLEQGDWGECGCNFCSNCGSDNREVTT